jgi:hypothetical protein
MALGEKTGGRRKGSRNKIPGDKRAAIERATALAELDRQGTSMGHIQIYAARHLFELAARERARGEAAQQDVVIRLLTAAAKVANDASDWLYPRLQAIKIGGPASHHIHLSDLRMQLGDKVDLASEDEIAQLFRDCARGAVPPVGEC